MALNTERILKDVRKLQKALKKTHKRLNPEDVHRLRTRARRMEVTLETLSPDPTHKERRLLRRLSRIRKKAGKVRDVDVFTSHLSSSGVNGEEDCLIQLFEYLGSKRHQHAVRLHKLMKKDAPMIRGQLKRTSGSFEKLLKHNHKNSRQNQAASNAIASARRLSSELATPATLNRGNLHAYRLKIRELRDLLQLIDNAGQKPFIETLDDVRDAIGEWHDWEELIAIANELLHHGPSCGLLRQLKAISAHKFELALSKTTKMRKDRILRSNRSIKDNVVRMNESAQERSGLSPHTAA